ncbi:MAG: nucleotidyltransferase domain-containing protein [Bacillota bacterium]
MMSVLQKRARIRQEYLRLAEEFIQAVSSRIPVAAAAVIGSVARGDFSDASDIDVVIISDGLPADLLARSAMLYADVPPRIEPKAYTKPEFLGMLSKKNPLAVATLKEGVVLVDSGGFLKALATGKGSEPTTSNKQTKCPGGPELQASEKR